MIISTSALKARFLAGMKPTQEDFSNLIDSFVHRQDDVTMRVAFYKEYIDDIEADTNTVESKTDFASTDALEVFRNGQLIDFNFEAPNTFTFTETIETIDVLLIKKTYIVTV